MIDEDEKKIFRVRNMKESDYGYVISSWTASMSSSKTFSGVNKQVIESLVQPHIRSILKDESVEKIVVCPSEEDEPIIAFAIAKAPVLFYLHVKGAFRLNGVMTDILNILGFHPGSKLILATDTNDAQRIMRKNIWDMTIRPDLLSICSGGQI